MTASVETPQTELMQPQDVPETRIPDELVLRAQYGDEAAREQTMGLSIPIALAVARRIAKEPAQVEDIAYGGLEKVYSHGLIKKRYAAPGNFNAWVSRVVQNNGFDLHRRNRRIQQVAVDPADYRLQRLTEPQTVEDIAEFKRADEAISAMIALAGVKKEFADPFILHHIDGYSYDEIAAILGVRMTTIRTRIHRAKRQLEQHKTRLQQLYETGSASQIV